MGDLRFRGGAFAALFLFAACGEAEPTANMAPAEAPASLPAAENAPRGRLPEGARPLAYDLDLTIDPREDRFSGTIGIALALDAPAKGIYLHGKDLNVTSVRVIPAAAGAQEGSYTEILPSGVAWLGFGGELPAGEAQIDIAYDAPFDTNLAGLFKVEEQGDAYALAKSESIQARKYMPGFDEPGFKAPFDIALTVPEGYAAISNGEETGREPAGEGLERVTFSTTRPLSTYLLSLAVGPFDVVDAPAIPSNEVRDDPIPLRGIARAGRGAELDYILGITPEFVRLFEEALGVPYPYEKLDIVAAPQWPSGATELAAAISYREERILADGIPPAAQREGLIRVHAHEIAHMWFGNLVTPPWWDDLWLKEGFASWGTPFVLNQWEPQGGHDLIIPEGAIRAMNADSLMSVRAVREPIAENDDIRNAYNAIPYSKGMALIGMADAYFGPEVFRPALGRYVKAFEDGAADSPDFFAAIGEATGEPALTESFRSFAEQPGVPLLRAELSCSEDGPRVSLSQSRYRPLGSAIEGGQDWVIPVCIAHGGPGGRGQTCALMREERATVDLDAPSCPAFIHPNAGGSGYYRFAMDETDTAALLANFSGLPAAEQLLAADSVFAAFAAGEAHADAVLDTIEAAAGAEARQVVTLPLGRIAGYAEGLLAGEDRARLLDFAAGLYRPRLDALAEPGDADARLLADRLTAFLAREAGDDALRAELAGEAAAFIGYEGDRDPDALDADRYGMAFAIGVEDLGKPFFDRLVAARAEIDDPRFDGASAAALGTGANEDVIEAARALALSGTLGTRETWSLVTALFSEPGMAGESWDWYTANFDALLPLIPEQWRRRTPTVARAFCDEGKIEEVEAFFEKVGEKIPGYERQLAETAETIRLCAALEEAKAAELAEALARRG